MSSFGSRLREERERLGLSAADIAALGRVSEADQAAFENDVSPLDARYLSDLADIEVDVSYVITGNPMQPHEGDGEPCERDCKTTLLAQYWYTDTTGKRLIAAVARLAAARANCRSAP